MPKYQQNLALQRDFARLAQPDLRALGAPVTKNCLVDELLFGHGCPQGAEVLAATIVKVSL
jgi:hypothetical protein